MIILTDCLRKKVDEGCIKVANMLSKRLKSRYPDTTLVSYAEGSEGADVNLRLNPLFINSSLFSLIKEKDEVVLYIPFSSNTLLSCIRTFVLSKVSRKGVKVVFALRHPMNALSKFFLKESKAEVVALSCDSYDFYTQIAENKVTYLKTGVDTQKFTPDENDEKDAIRDKYGIPKDKIVVLHIGHLNSGRNVSKLMELPDYCHGVLVLSSVTKEYREEELYKQLTSSSSVTIIDEYIENIEQMYRMSDVYLFPVCEQGSCIDVPLSVLEAASCNTPVVCTRYGELKSFENKDGFYFIDSSDWDNLGAIIKKASDSKVPVRDAVVEYDWDASLEHLLN